jgi:hypothetical protein
MTAMKLWLKELLSILFGKNTNPVYRRELAGWSYIGPWRKIRRGCLPLIMVLFAATTCLCGGSCGLTVGPSMQSPSDWWIVLLVAILAGLIIGETFLRLLTGLAATGLASTAISAEIEAETFSLLRLTLIPPRQIVFAKFGAVIRQIRTPLIILMIVRGVMIVGTLITVVVLTAAGLAFSGFHLSDLALPLASTGAVASGLLLVVYFVVLVIVLVAILLWIAYFIFQPVLDMMLYSALGLFASSLARTRTNGLVTAGALRVVLWMGTYVLSQIVTTALSLFGVPLMTLPGIPQWISGSQIAPGFLVVLAIVASIGTLLIGIVIQIALSLGLLGLTSDRAARLPNLG